MRNYFAAIGLNRLASVADIDAGINSLSASELAEEDDLKEILTTSREYKHYQRLHLQYEAMAAVLAHDNCRLPMDNHNWQKRLVEFEADEESLDLSD